jgi:hypothetical protein
MIEGRLFLGTAEDRALLFSIIDKGSSNFPSAQKVNMQYTRMYIIIEPSYLNMDTPSNEALN